MAAPRGPAAGTTDLVALGAAATVGQTVLLREAMAALGGSELAWGGVLTLWLGGMALGAGCGIAGWRSRAAAAAPALVLLLTGASAVLLRAMPRLLVTTPGEIAGVWPSVWVWALAVLPPAAVGGWGFPVMAARWREQGGAGQAYTLEALGALGGGLAFTFILAGYGSAWAVVAALGAVSAAALVARRRLGAAAACAAAAVLLAAPAARLLEAAGWRWSGRVGALAGWTESRHQRLEVAGTAPSAVYADGALLGSYPDPYRVGPRAHLALALHPAPRRVLAIGALADGSVVPILAHGPERLDLVEEDPALVTALPRWFGAGFAAALADPRVHVHADDPLDVVRCGGRWDEIVLLDGDPVSLRRNRTRTVEFLALCRSRLSEGGLVVVRVGAADTYLGGAGGALLGAIFSSLREVFPQVRAVPGEEVLLVAGDGRAPITLDGATLASRLAARGIADPMAAPALVAALADRERGGPLEAALARMPAAPNRTGRPGAVILAAALHEGRTAPDLLRGLLALASLPAWVAPLAAAFVAGGLVVAGLRRRGPGGEVATAVGFASLGVWLLLLWAWQAARGSTFAALGALSGLFMAGIAGGSEWAARRRPVGALPAACGGLALTALLAGSALPLAHPALVIPAGLAVAGALTGAAFPGLALRLGGEETRRAAGLGFAFDEIGAAAAALLVGLVVLPWAGMQAAAVSLAVVSAAAAASLGVASRRGRSWGGRNE